MTTKKFADREFKDIEADTEKAGYRVVDMTPVESFTKTSFDENENSGKLEFPEKKDNPTSFVDSIFWNNEYVTLKKIDELKPVKDQKAISQSLVINPEDMMFMIRDTSTGAFYDIREQDTEKILTQEETKLTKLKADTGKKAWDEWWQKKRKNNKQLLVAAEKGELKEVQNLLDSNIHGDLIADINSKGLDEFTPLHFAASEGHLEIAQNLIKNGANIESLSSAMRTPLHVACNRGATKIIELLLNAGANKNAQDNDGNTPLHILSEGGWLEALEYYLKQKPDKTVKNKFGELAAEVAANVDVRNLFKKYTGKDNKTEELKKEGIDGSYSRTVVQNLILHNNRADMIRGLMFQAQMAGNGGPSEPEKPTGISAESKQPKETGTKSRRVKILEASKKISELDPETIKKLQAKIKTQPINSDDADLEERIGPEYFDIITMLGKGSFGEVYLVKYKLTGKPYAMKVLNKKRIIGSNLVKYAKAERNVLCISKNPFIVGLDFAFQTSDKLFLILEYCPGYFY